MLYDLNSGSEAQAAIGINMVDEGISSGNMAMVQRIVTALNENGEIMKRVHYLSNGEQRALYINYETMFEYRILQRGTAQNLSIGDVFEYTLGRYDVATRITILFEASRARGDIRDIYRDGSVEFQNVNIFSNNAPSVTEEVRFYYGHVAGLSRGTNWNRLIIYGRNDFRVRLDEHYTQTYVRTIAINENTRFLGYYSYFRDEATRVRMTDFNNITVLSSLRNAVVDSDLVFVKTVGGIAVDVIVVKP